MNNDLINTSKNNRIDILDTIKGLLVLAMLVHHASSASHIIGFDPVRSIFSFVSSAFILFSGFIFGYLLLNGYMLNPIYRMKKDLIRSFRLFFLYGFSNIILYLVNYRSLQYNYDFINWIIVCLRPFPPEVAVFSLLNAFAYYFIISSLIFGIVSFILGKTKLTYKFLIGVFSLLIVISLSLNIDSNTLFYTAVLYGFGGCIMGIVILLLAGNLATLKLDWIGWVALFAFSILGILSLSGNFNSYHYYLAYVLFSCIVVWHIAKLLERANTRPLKHIHILGEYSLVCYLMQAVVLQAISLTIARSLYDYFGQWLSFFLVLVVMFLIQEGLVRGISKFRRDSEWFDKTYCYVFG